ncbi:hypothetical protein [Empedobacter falsenii]|uniref:DUF4890 domain-containing protein n=1 Tax=Empedobacter falsenii TaxID=343874 RepID=A0A376FZ13_9FLAO|nr:hypothetical protein [Empedobacter falsenii]STD53615.1 Uncharacterised protein [Empedobacter falsenii]
MKKAFLLANIMMVMAVSAQQRPQQGERSGNRKEQRERPTVDQQLKKFDQYNLSSAQKKKVKSLLESNLSTSNFNKKLEKILSKKQYAQYIKDQKNTSNKPNVSQKSKSTDSRKTHK